MFQSQSENALPIDLFLDGIIGHHLILGHQYRECDWICGYCTSDRPVGMMEQDPKSRLEHWALIRHSAVSWIEQCLNQGNTLGRALALASELDWGGRRYSPRTLEGWLYEWRAQGFGALERQSRRDKGLSKAISPQAAEAIIKLRLQQPSLAISTLVRQLQES